MVKHLKDFDYMFKKIGDTYDLDLHSTQGPELLSTMATIMVDLLERIEELEELTKRIK